MQQPAVPELAHTQTRPIHWVATAAAVAGVVALSSVIQPGSATAAQPPTATRPGPAPAAVAAPTTTGVDFPLDCGPVKAVVAKKASGDLDGDGRPETVAVVHCDSTMGTAPDGVYVLTRSTGTGTARIVATLVDPKERLTVTDFSLKDGTIGATLLGYSSDAVPNCCPDLKTPTKWGWNGHAFVRSTPEATDSV